MHDISWKVYDGDKLIINEENIKANISDNILTYVDQYGTHIIDKEDKKYKKISDESTMIVDFRKNMITFEFDGQALKYDIDTKFTDGSVLELEYSIGDEVKKIIVKVIK